MGHVTDGGLEPEPDASIKAAAHPVNRFLALTNGGFGLNLEQFGDFEGVGAGRGGMAGQSRPSNGRAGVVCAVIRGMARAGFLLGWFGAGGSSLSGGRIPAGAGMATEVGMTM